MERRESPTGKTLFVDDGDREIGSKGAFYAVFSDQDREHRWGYFCANCESFETAMDSMGRVECTACRNLKKPDEWDAAHE